MKTLTLDVQPLQAALAEVAQRLRDEGCDLDARISFSTPELLWSVLTARRWELLKALCGVGPISIREAARRVGRDVKGVHGDVVALLEAGVLNRTKDGIEFPFEAVHVDFTLQAAA